MSTRVVMGTLPMCDIHKYDLDDPNVVAKYDAKTARGPWAYMCESHMVTHSMFGVSGLGTGKGQELVVAEVSSEPVAAPADLNELDMWLD